MQLDTNERIQVRSSNSQIQIKTPPMFFFPHYPKEGLFLYLFTTFQLNSVLRLEISAF